MIERFTDQIQARPVRPVRVRQVPGRVDLVWFDPSQKINGPASVFVARRVFLDLPGLVKRQFHEVQPVAGHPRGPGPGLGFLASDKRLDPQHLGRVQLARTFAPDRRFDLSFE